VEHLATNGGEEFVVAIKPPARRRNTALAVLGVIVMASCGCKTQQNARYIYQDGEFGVIGIPQNSPLGSKDYQIQPAEMMAQHVPGG
jgi:hypothetical protein